MPFVTSISVNDLTQWQTQITLIYVAQEDNHYISLAILSLITGFTIITLTYKSLFQLRWFYKNQSLLTLLQLSTSNLHSYSAFHPDISVLPCVLDQGVKLTSFYAGLKSTFQKKGPHFAKIRKSEAILLNTKINTKKNYENAGFLS